MGESPIERRQREFAEKAKDVRPAKTDSSEYVGTVIIVLILAAVFIFGIIMFAS